MSSSTLISIGATLFGVPGRHHDKLTDSSLAALRPEGPRRSAEPAA
jgi:hypothetical protein